MKSLRIAVLCVFHLIWSYYQVKCEEGIISTAKPVRVSSSTLQTSSSAEDQLTPLLLTTGIASCTNCPRVVCTLSKVSYTKTTTQHNWRVDGLPDYIAYLEKFQTSFEMNSEVTFNTSSPNDGEWSFKFSRQDQNPLELRAMYKYSTKSSSVPKISFDLGLTAHVEDESITFPSQISSQATSTGRSRTPHPLRRDGSDGAPPPTITYHWAYMFVWSDIQSRLISLIETVGLESQSVEFKFVINSYQEKQPNINSNTDCRNWGEEHNNGSGGGSQVHPHHGGYIEPNPGNNATWPPFLHHMYSLMKDDKYTDLTIKSGDDEFQIHRVIASYSSPLLATMIFNKTYDKSESLIDFGEDIGSDVVEELIRYMYTGKVEDIEEIADRLLVASTTYGFPVLKKLCESALIKQVKTENAFSMYALGAEVGSMRLKRRAFNIMKENKSKIVVQSEEFRKLSVHHPDVMYELFLS